MGNGFTEGDASLQKGDLMSVSCDGGGRSVCVSLILHRVSWGSASFGLWSLEDKALFFKAFQEPCSCCCPDLHLIAYSTHFDFAGWHRVCSVPACVLVWWRKHTPSSALLQHKPNSRDMNPDQYLQLFAAPSWSPVSLSPDHKALFKVRSILDIHFACHFHFLCIC